MINKVSSDVQSTASVAQFTIDAPGGMMGLFGAYHVVLCFLQKSRVSSAIYGKYVNTDI